MASPVILMMTPFPPIQFALPTPPVHSGFTIPAGKVFRSFSRPAKVILFPRAFDEILIFDYRTALNEAKVEVRIQFKDVTQGIFKDIARNELVIRIQPSEAVYLKLNAKTPGLYTRAIPTEMDLTYKRRFTDAKIPEAYEALILDALKGDHSNFVRHDELDVAWKVCLFELHLRYGGSSRICLQIFTPILHWIEGRQGNPPKPVSYPYGSRGPKELDPFIQKYGYKRSGDL
jgi:glucose-6-phosphate 1-dehydrogenase